MTDSTPGATTKRKNTGGDKDKGRRYRSVGGMTRFTRCTHYSLGRHLDLDKTGRERTGGLGFLYKRERETGGRGGLSSIRIGWCASA